MKKVPILLAAALLFAIIPYAQSNAKKPAIKPKRSVQSFYYNIPGLKLQAERFETHLPVRLRSISVVLTGETDSGSARLRVFGYEGGANVPLYMRDIIEPVIIEKHRIGLDTINIFIKNSPLIDYGQYFIGVDSLSRGVYPVTYNDSVNKSCSCASTGDFYRQSFMDRNGKWHSGKYHYGITAETDTVARQGTEYFSPADVTGIDSMSDNNCINVFDFDRDSLPDILAGSVLYRNLRNFVFEKACANILPQVKARAHIVLDINRDGYMDILFASLIDTPLSATGNRDGRSELYINKAGKFEKYDIEIPILRHPQAFAVSDINNDNYPDLLVIDRIDSIAGRPYLLINEKNNTFGDAGIRMPANDTGRPVSVSFGLICSVDGDALRDILLIAGGSAIYYIRQTAPGRFSPPAEIINTSGYGNESNYPRNINSVKVAGRRDNTIELAAFADWAFRDVYDTLCSAAILSINPETKEYRISAPFFFQEYNSGGDIADINNDGIDDIITASGTDCYSGQLYIGRGNNKFEQRTLLSGFNGHSLGRDIILHDMNGDGLPDLLHIAGSRLCIYENHANEAESAGNSIKIDASAIPYASSIEIKAADADMIYGHYERNGLLRQDCGLINIGIGRHDRADTVIVKTTDGSEYAKYGVSAGSVCEIRESDACESAIPVELSAQPNPFRASVTLYCKIKTARDYKIYIANMEGREIRLLLKSELNPGEKMIVWDGNDEYGNPAANGIYFIKIESGAATLMEKVIKMN